MDALPLSVQFISFSCKFWAKIWSNKNAFQKDVYRPLQWPSGWLGGVVSLGGVCPGLVSTGGVSAQGGVCLGGVCLGVGGCTPPVNRITDRCKDITFP